MNEDKARKLVYVEKKTEIDTCFDGRCVWYECPECGRRFNWLGRGDRDKYCPRCGNYISWAKLDYENYKQSDSSFNKNMSLHDFMEDAQYGHTWEYEVSMTYSHSEREILKGCISLMQGLVDSFKEYLDFVGFVPDGEEEKLSLSMTYFGIVQRLFLWSTSHSGGTSTHMKCEALGIEDASERVIFE